MHKLKGQMALVVLLLILCTACAGGQEASDAPAPTASATPTAAPTSTPTPAPTPRAYGRDRTGEYVYDEGGKYHEIDCPDLHGDLVALRFEDAQRNNMLSHEGCAKLGEGKETTFLLNEGFTRDVQVKRKIQLVSEAGAVVQDIVLVTSQEDPSYDINKMSVNYVCRFLYKEFKIDPAVLQIYTIGTEKVYHDMQCEKTAASMEKNIIALAEAYDQGLKPHAGCEPPIEQIDTMPIKADDDAHFYLVSQKFIKDVLAGKGVPAAAMNIDLERVLGGYYD